MTSAVRSLLVLTAVLAAGVAAVVAGPADHGHGADPAGTVAASLADTSWGDDYAPPRQ
ncbi:hypothetical protein ACF08W_05670 [Streptomyces sp. NPDC015144]|uniref:hypothetical protein n=1 Tax=Streptomyces sp. NPDC015144 TaxID=3364944 RepID=UPI0036F7935F